MRLYSCYSAVRNGIQTDGRQCYFAVSGIADDVDRDSDSGNNSAKNSDYEGDYTGDSTNHDKGDENHGFGQRRRCPVGAIVK